MKSTFFLLLSASILATMPTQAQVRMNEKIEEKDNEVRIFVERQDGNNKKTFDRSYSTKGLTATQKEALIDRVKDSLETHGFGPNARTLRKGNYQIEVESHDDSDDKDTKAGTTKKKYRVYKDGQKWEQFGQDMERWGDDLGRNMDRLGDDIARNFERNNKKTYRWSDDKNGNTTWYFDGFEGASSSTVKNLKVYPNSPFNGTLNLNFSVPEKGDVSISITDTEGKQVASEKIQGFEGKYVGQITLKNKDKGTYFVLVTQGKDGVTKRVVVE